MTHHLLSKGIRVAFCKAGAVGGLHMEVTGREEAKTMRDDVQKDHHVLIQAV